MLVNDEKMIHGAISNLQSNFPSKVSLSQRAILTARYELLMKVYGIIGSPVPGMLQEVQSAVSVHEAEANELNYPVKLLK